jgi:NADH-quinone oxidoreductase subunit L
MVNPLLAILIPLLPLAGFALIALNVRRFSHSVASGIACTAVGAAFVLAVVVFLQLPEGGSTIHLFDWIKVSGFEASMSFLIDPLSSLMMLIITGVGFLIHVYSIGYMHDDNGFNRFFSYLNLFVFFMLLLVMGSNYLVMFIGWEGVGLCSYLLIGFWFKNQPYNDAANKAFIMNRIGDLGMLAGIILLSTHAGSIEYSSVFSIADQIDRPTLTAATILLFIGAMGKSAQLPLYTWLPDAMAGPTPVSALIHAATMVTAGIYMVARNNILYSLSPAAMDLVAFTGLATAMFAATIALTQNDIKKVLAYSTVSQLGLMFVALGVGAFSTGVFHMATHAFFKALLFLGAGSVIHALHGEQDIRNMGGLRKFIPITFVTFLIGVLAISGIPPFAGFFSKDEILVKAFEHNKVLWFFSVVTSLLTAFYMFRLLFLVFFGQVRASAHSMSKIHESPKVITIPLIALAVLSAIAGFAGMPGIFRADHWLQGFLGPVFASAQHSEAAPMEHSTEWGLMATVVALTLIVIFLAYMRYIKRLRVPGSDGSQAGLHNVVYKKYWVDEIYQSVIVNPLYALARVFEAFIEKLGIDKMVNSIGFLVLAGSRSLRLMQTGGIGFYISFMVIGIMVVLLLSIFV